MSDLERRNYMMDIDSSSSSSNSSDDDSTCSDDSNNSSDEENSFFIGDVEEFEAELESKIHPHFKEIAAAIRKGHVNDLNVALDNFKGNIDENLINGETALHYSCRNYSRPCFKLLIQRGANIEAVNIDGANPLHTACVLGLYRNVKIILDYTPNRDIIYKMIKSVNIFGNTPLHEAVVGRNIDIIKLLFTVEAIYNINGINERNIFGQTPLHQAAKYGNAKVVKLLLEFGASTKIENLEGKIPFDLAKPNSDIRRILENSD